MDADGVAGKLLRIAHGAEPFPIIKEDEMAVTGRPSPRQLAVLSGLLGGKKIARDDTDTSPRWYCGVKRLSSETAKVLYCRGWIEFHSRTGLITLFSLSDSGRSVIEKSKV